MLYPSIKEVKEYLKEYDIVPVFYELLTDSCTPIYIFNALKNSENAFILESVDNKNQWGRYSFIGVSPKAEIKIENGEAVLVNGTEEKTEKVNNPIDYITNYMSKYKSPKFPNFPKFTGGLVGYFGYDTIRYVEKKLTNTPFDDIKLPDVNLFLYDEIVAYDHLTSKVVIIFNIYKGDVEKQYSQCEEKIADISSRIKNYVPKASTIQVPQDFEVKSNFTKDEFVGNVLKAKEYITDGDIFQVVLSQRFEIDNPPDAFDVYRLLRATNPSPYLYYFDMKDYKIAGASPEMLVNVNNGAISTKPIAGTIGRGKTEEEDNKFEKMLLSDKKEIAEHTMLVDLGRNDVGKVSKFGTVKVTDFMTIEKYSKVMHIVSNVKGELQEDKNSMDALMSVIPAGTLSGAPKIRAMEIIDEIENRKRGVYGGTVGYLGFDGNMDTCIAIRTVLFKDKKAYVQAGAGIVADSVPEKEYEETENKALAVINAIREAGKL